MSADERQSEVTANTGLPAAAQAVQTLTPADVYAELTGIHTEIAKLSERIETRPPSGWPLWRMQLLELEARTKLGLIEYLNEADSAVRVLAKLRRRFKPAEVAVPEGDASRMWERAGIFYLWNQRYHEALAVFSALYDRMLEAQDSTGIRCHKGMPLCWISDCYWAMGFPVLAKRYLMLTLCEDAISDQAQVHPELSGVYFRMVWRHGMQDDELRWYYRKCSQLYSGSGEQWSFPERVVQDLDHRWMTELPAAAEAGVYSANRRYVASLIKEMGDRGGKTLELLAEYLLSCMPGCRTRRHVLTHSTDLDVVCSVEGFEVDFRSELGRYFVCECKDWEEPANFTAFAKFCRVLDSAKARFGILFSREGLSGEGKTKDAEREQLKVFQDRGMVIVVVDKSDLEELAQGANFTNMLRAKYERVRLDLRDRRK